MRLPFFGAPLTADEGGYAEAARLWERGDTLYRDIWVDRPQGLILVFRAVLHLGSSPNVIRGVAAFVGALTVVATMLVALRLARRITAYACGVLMATVGASPFLESFTLAGELLSSLAAILSVLAFTAYLRSRSVAWLLGAGLLAGCAVMIKQSGFDAGLAIVAYLVWTERRRSVRAVAVVVAGAVVPVLAGALAAVSLHSWWFAVVGYRGSGDSLVTGSVVHRLDLLAQSLPGAAKGLGLLVLLAALGWRGSPLLVRLWLGAAALGVLGGGNFHFHYYLQLVPPLSILAGAGVEKLITRRLGLAALGYAAVAIATVAVTAPLWFESSSAQARDVWPKDPHLVQDAAVARYIDAHTRPGQKVLDDLGRRRCLLPRRPGAGDPLHVAPERRDDPRCSRPDTSRACRRAPRAGRGRPAPRIARPHRPDGRDPGREVPPGGGRRGRVDLPAATAVVADRHHRER